MSVKSTIMKFIVVSICLNSVSTLVYAASPPAPVDIHTWQWRHGSEDCKTSPDPVIEVLKVNAASFVLRQDKCSHFEAPFMYLLVGKHRALLFDTGATTSPDEFPIHQTVIALLDDLQGAQTNTIEEVLVMHSHHHKDHYAGDTQFEDQAKVTLVKPDRESLATQFGMPATSIEEVEFDLGLRKIKLIPIPGHQRDSVALFDLQTGWLLTGDTFYPGSIRVEEWSEFKLSIERLTEFTQQHKVTAILGGHVEMRSDRPKIYRIGSKYQPKELPLALRVADLIELNAKIKNIEKSKTLKFEKFIISPFNFFERQLQKVLSLKTSQSEVLKSKDSSEENASLKISPRSLTPKYSSADKRTNPFIGHQFQQQSVIHSAINYV